MEDDFGQCLVLNTRMAARAITRAYDRKLRPFGVTAAQFSLLVSIRRAEGRSVSTLAQGLGMDRTTLSRNLDLLQRKGLVACEAADKGNGRLCHLAPKGQTLVGELVPHWRQAQADMRRLLGQADLSSTVASLQKLARL